MPAGKPNVLVILADDLGWFDLSCYHQGMMGGRTPNIDRIAGVRFTDFYSQASCTAGNENVLQAAASHNWTVIDMAADWSTIYAT